MLHFARSVVNEFLTDVASLIGLGGDPRLVYSLAAAALLLLVSLFTGWRRLDFVALFRPTTLLRLCVLVLAAFALVVTAEQVTNGTGPWFHLLVGISRLPLYVAALAFGPSAGLLAGLLFSAATAASEYPGWTEALLGLELTVLGWLAVSPSPRVRRWAGSVDALLAHALTLGTAGVAFEVWRGGEVTVLGLLSTQRAVLPGLLLAWLLLFALGPRFYQRFLPASRIDPTAESAATVQPAHPTYTHSQGRSYRRVVPTVSLPPLERAPRRTERSLVEPHLPSDDPNG